MVKRFLNLKKCLRKWRCEFKKKKQNSFNWGTFVDRALAHSGEKVQCRIYPGDLITRMGDREIHSVSGRVPDYPGELACIWRTNHDLWSFKNFSVNIFLHKLSNLLLNGWIIFLVDCWSQCNKRNKNCQIEEFQLNTLTIICGLGKSSDPEMI